MALDADSAPHQLHESLRESEADPGPVNPGVAHGQAREGDEESIELVRRDAGAGVAYLDAQPTVEHLLTGEGNRAPFAVVFDRVGEQVQDDLLEPLTVGHHVP